MRSDMKRLISIVENAEFDYSHNTSHTTNYFPPFDEFTKRGASYRIKRNDPRYGDNPMQDGAALHEDDEPLTPDEFRGWYGQMPPSLKQAGEEVLQAIEASDLEPVQARMLYSVLHAMCANTSARVEQGNANEEVVSAIRYAQRESGAKIEMHNQHVNAVIGLLRLFARKIEHLHGSKPSNQTRGRAHTASPMPESVQSPQLLRLQRELNKVVSDEEIISGLSLAQTGLHKLAAVLGVGPEDVHILLSSLTQNLRDAARTADMQEAYHTYMEAAADEQVPFADDDLSVEKDALGSDTVRSASSGKSKFLQGSAAAELEKKLAHPNADQQGVLRAMMAEATDPESFEGEIQADTGSYNFPWKLAGRHGFATAFYRRDSATPELKITSLRDADGNDTSVPPNDQRALTQQALDFIGDA